MVYTSHRGFFLPYIFTFYRCLEIYYLIFTPPTAEIISGVRLKLSATGLTS